MRPCSISGFEAQAGIFVVVVHVEKTLPYF